MKQPLIVLLFTLFSLASNPFDTLTIKTETSTKFHLTYQSASKGNINAQFDIAMMYGTGTYVEKNEKKAFNWLHKSAFNGHVQAQYLMGVSFKQGIGVRVQKYLAIYWFKKAIKAGHQRAIVQLAKLERELQSQKTKYSYAFK